MPRKDTRISAAADSKAEFSLWTSALLSPSVPTASWLTLSLNSIPRNGSVPCQAIASTSQLGGLWHTRTRFLPLQLTSAHGYPHCAVEVSAWRCGEIKSVSMCLTSILSFPLFLKKTGIVLWGLTVGFADVLAARRGAAVTVRTPHRHSACLCVGGCGCDSVCAWGCGVIEEKHTLCCDTQLQKTHTTIPGHFPPLPTLSRWHCCGSHATWSMPLRGI